MRYKPQSTFDNVMDVMMRGVYASANVAESLLGQSPYDNPVKAAWKGLTAERRVTYSDITGDPYSGLGFDVMLDPVTYIPFGAIGKLSKATGATKLLKGVTTKLPANVVKAGSRMAMAGGKVGRVGAGVKRFGTAWDDLYKVIGATLKGGLTDPNHIVKVAGGWDEAVDAAKAAKVPGKVLKHVEAGGKVTDDIIKNYKLTDDGVAALKDIESTAGMLKTVAGSKFTVKGEWEAMRRELRPLYKSLKQLEKKEPAKVKAILEALEKSLPEARTVAGHSRKVWGMTDEFYGAIKKAGLLTDEEIQAIQKKFVAPELLMTKKGIEQLELFDEVAAMSNRMKGVSNVTPTNIMAYQMPEFRAIMDAAAKKVGPEMGQVLRRYMQMKSNLTERIMSKGMFSRYKLRQFANELGLTHVKHLPLDKLKNVVNVQSQSIRKAVANRANEIAERYVVHLMKHGETDVKTLTSIKGKFWKAMNKMLKSTNPEDLGPGLFDDFLDSASKLAEKNPAAEAALKQLQSSMDDLHKYRKYMGTINKFNKLNESKFFETNLANILVAEEIKMKTALVWHDTLQKMVKKFPNIIRRVERGAKYNTKEWTKVSNNLLGDFVVRKSYASSFGRVFNLATDSGGNFSKFVRAWDKGTGVWKYTTLIPFGKFHIRNFTSEILLNFNGGVPLLSKEYGNAIRFYYKARVLKDPKAVALYDDLVKRGVIRTGFFSKELGTTGGAVKTALDTPFVEKGILGKLKGVPGLKQYLSGMERLGEFTEDIPRITQYLYGMRKGKKFMQKYGVPLIEGTRKDMAAMYVRAFHPVYDSFTAFEQNVLRRIFPFWSWYRFNIPLQARLFVQNPSHYALLEKTRRAVTEIRGGKLPSEETPDWIKNGYAVGWGGKRGTETYFLMKGWLPETELARVMTPKAIRRTALQLVHPVKSIFEVAWGYDTFRNKSLPAYPGEKVEAFGAKIDPRVHHLLRTIRAYNDLNRLIWGDRHKGWDKVLYSLFGKSYDVDTKKAAKRLKYELRREVLPKLKYGIKQARKNDDMDTFRELRKRYNKLKRQAERL